MVSAREAAAHVFVDDLAGPVLALDPADRHHLFRALRLRAGEAVSATDGRGGWRPCVVTPAGEVAAAGDVVEVPAPAPPVTIGLAVPKGDRLEWAVQKLTEVGADRIVLLAAARGVVRWDAERAARQVERLRVVARQAAMQSRRLTVPVVDGPCPVAALAATSVLAEPGGPPPSLAQPTVLVGPEGGWAPDELAAGGATVGLGPTVLRTETAAVVAATLLVALRSGVVR